MSAWEDDASAVCPACKATFDIHEFVSPKCGGDERVSEAEEPKRLPLGHPFEPSQRCSHTVKELRDGREVCGRPASEHERG